MPIVQPAPYGSLLMQKQAIWAPAYESQLQIFGAGALLVPMGDDNHQNGARTTVTTIGDEQVVFTYTEAVDAFDTPPTFEGPGFIPVIHFNESDEWLETPNAAFWNDSAGSSEPSYFFSCWVNIVASTSTHTLWSKSDINDTNGTDWNSQIANTERFQYRLFDDTNNAYIGSFTSVLANGWHHIVMTKHDDGITSASVLTYADGVLDRSDTDAGSYADQQDGTEVVRIGAETDGSNPNGLSIAGGPLGPMFIAVGANTVPTADEILASYQLGRALLGV